MPAGASSHDASSKQEQALPGSDYGNGYGWVSIALHWLTAAAILVLLFAGDSIGTVGQPARHLHTTIAASAWAILLVRVIWRLWQGHPREPDMSAFSFYSGLVVHYLLLIAIIAMLVSGPLAGWSGGGFDIFGIKIPGANPPSPAIYQLARTTHVLGATTLAIGTTAHVAGVLKHMFINQDHTLDRIMVPPRRESAKS